MARRKADDDLEGTAETASGFSIFKKPGPSKHRVAINIGQVSVIEEDGPGHYFVQVGGVRHAIQSEASLEELTGTDAPPAQE